MQGEIEEDHQGREGSKGLIMEPLLGGQQEVPKAGASGQRLASLDIFRGLTIAVMILVDDAGGVYPSINHAPWNGITLADFVMPFFLFIVGVAMAMVFKRNPQPEAAIKKLVIRCLKLTVLGILLQGGLYRSAPGSLTLSIDLTRIRLCGILQRIALAYLIVGLCEIITRRPQVPMSGSMSLFKAYSLHWAVALLLATLYLGLTLGLYVPDWSFKDPVSEKEITVHCGVRGDLSQACNAARYIDSLFLGLGHLYPRSAYKRSPECSTLSPQIGPPPRHTPAWCNAPYDPEGLLSSLAAVISCVIGLHYGHVLVHFKSHKDRLLHWVPFSLALVAAGLALHVAGLPINKMLYSMSYVLVTGGVAGICFSFFYAVVDIGGLRWQFAPLEWMGMNALLVFVMAACDILESVLRAAYWKQRNANVTDFLQYRVFQRFLDDKAFAYLLYVCLKISFWCIVSGVLHKRKIYWKF